MFMIRDCETEGGGLERVEVLTRVEGILTAVLITAGNVRCRVDEVVPLEKRHKTERGFPAYTSSSFGF